MPNAKKIVIVTGVSVSVACLVGLVALYASKYVKAVDNNTQQSPINNDDNEMPGRDAPDDY